MAGSLVSKGVFGPKIVGDIAVREEERVLREAAVLAELVTADYENTAVKKHFCKFVRKMLLQS